MHKPIVLCLVYLSLLSCSPGNKQTTSSCDRTENPTAQDIASNYTTLTLITKQPVMVNPEFALACAGISQTRMDQARNVFGPHTNTSIKIFMNDLAASSFKRSTTPYPVGSIIVKQKTLLSNSPPDNIGVGGMIKRHPGYDPKHGDWEYFYFDQPTNIESGKIDSCVQCHLAAKKDRVFGTWLNKYY